MEARNLAIVFGPTLVRTADNSMLTMITDMSHQCHITEALINYVSCFSSLCVWCSVNWDSLPILWACSTVLF